jgi:hypothetical protein
MTVYAVVQLEITDRAAYDRYQARFSCRTFGKQGYGTAQQGPTKYAALMWRGSGLNQCGISSFISEIGIDRLVAMVS